jgi:hypothetical protein
MLVVTKDVFRIPGKTWWVKFSSDHGWGCDTGDGPLWFQERGNFMPLLPLLEIDFEKAKRVVEDGANEVGLPSEARAAFPFEDIIVFALEWETDYWPTSAVDWVERGFPMSDRIAKSLTNLSEKRNFQQRTRHRAIALVKSWGRKGV